MAYRSELALTLEDAATFYLSDEGTKLDPKTLLSRAPDDVVFYICGPDRLINAVRNAANQLGIDPARVRFEKFTTAIPVAGNKAFEVHLSQSGTVINVASDQTILDALLDADIDANYGCKSGTCGMCAVKVLEGTPEHRDSVLSDAERDQAGLMCPCISRAKSDSLVLDI